MSTVDLLAPRFKVIADYPGNRFKIGIIFICENGIGRTEGDHHVTTESNLKAFPNIFQPLEWWEERKVEDMPEYVRHTSVNKIEKVIRWCIKSQLNYVAIKHTTWDLHYLMPATEQEYINSQNK